MPGRVRGRMGTHNHVAQRPERLSGCERSQKEFEALLAAAMLRLRRVIPTGDEFDVIEAVTR